MDNLIYERQKTLKLNIPQSVCIVGCGGVGSWVSLFLAQLGTKNIILIDYDIVEASNLNRTPFKLEHVGWEKTEAVADLIKERRLTCRVIQYKEKFQDVLEKLKLFKFDYIIDCRDNLQNSNQLREMSSKYIKAGYDGLNITVDTLKENKAWGEGEVRYQIVPSFVGAPVFLASLITNMIATNIWNNSIYTLEINNIINTFLGGEK
ncbi:MAG: ThiF family adenylyltransferase [Ignavibacterium sp.]